MSPNQITHVCAAAHRASEDKVAPFDPNVRSTWPENLAAVGVAEGTPAFRWAMGQVNSVVEAFLRERGGLVPSSPDAKPGLAGKDLEELRRGLGTLKSSAPTKPHTNEGGDFVLPLRTPSEARARGGK